MISRGSGSVQEVPDMKKPLKIKGFSFCRRPGSNRYGYFYPRDFKSRASASSATTAHIIIM